jgi:hypothetical protein
MLLWLGLVSGEAQADDARSEAVEDLEVDAATGRRIKWQERTEVIFDGVDVDGEIVRPSTKLIGERPPPRFSPFIELRRDWRREMRASLDEVR